MHLFDVDALKKLILLLLSLHLPKYQDFIAAMKIMLDGDKTKGTTKNWKKITFWPDTFKIQQSQISNQQKILN